MDLQKVEYRVDQALGENRRAERLIVNMALALFVVGLLVVSVAYWLSNPYIASGSILVQAFLIFPVNEIRKLRRDNLILQTFPTLIFGLPPDKATEQIIILLGHLRGARS